MPPAEPDGAAAAGPPTAACCSDFYAQDWVRLLANDGFHPGGANLTRRTAAAMRLPQTASVLDLGSGAGHTTRLLAAEFGFDMIGAEVNRGNAAFAARAAARAADRRTRFVCADARALPFAAERFDGVVCECVLSLIADKPNALAEIRRVAKPGARVAISDMSRDGPLPADFATAAASWACLADAPGETAMARLLESAGLRLRATVDESRTLSESVRKLKRRLALAAAGGLAAGALPLDVATIRHWLDRFSGLVAAGSIRYLVFQVERR